MRVTVTGWPASASVRPLTSSACPDSAALSTSFALMGSILNTGACLSTVNVWVSAIRLPAVSFPVTVMVCTPSANAEAFVAATEIFQAPFSPTVVG
ncbi:hypothetical protein D3C71_1666560 [compost metagenome]